MRMYLTASLILALGFIHPVHLSFSALPEDLEGSGYDPDTYGSGSGDWSEQVSPGEMKNNKKEGEDPSNSQDVRIPPAKGGGGTQNTFHGSSVPSFDNMHGPAEHSGSGFVVVANSKQFLESKDVLAGVIAGGVIGVTLAVALAAILIYKWQKEDDGGYILGKQSDEDYHKPNREEVVV
ncbi:syndecan-1-like [Morone saxatilis]|uniref:syndecan-1-like n=1 Tax=Morone saxatilis TaxID=34816 RepID=UPI0015E23A73|nr:syndecan-1-like [Morone saxatilis]